MGKSIFQMYETSEQAENEGQWLNYGPGPNGKDQRVLVARMGPSNKKFSVAYERFTREFGKQMDVNSLEDETVRAATAHIMADTVVLDWDNVCGRDGKPIPYSKTAVYDLLLELHEFMQDLILEARRRENFLAVQDVTDAGKSETS